MMASPKDRKEFFALLQSVNEGNREYYSRFGNWRYPQIKIYWVEINEKFFKPILEKTEGKNIDKGLYEIVHEEQPYWIDIGDKRIWQVFTFAETEKATRIVRDKITSQKGADSVWLPERFMQKMIRGQGFNDRGFGIKFQDILSSDEPSSDFSAKFWVGKDGGSEYQDFLTYARKIFAVSTARFGKNESKDGKGLSGQLYELYFNGHMTVNTCDDIEEMFALFESIRNTYKAEIEMLEKERKIGPISIEVDFSRKIDKEGFEGLTSVGEGLLRLWLQPYSQEDGMSRYCGVDLHTGDFIQIDLSEDYSYISTSPGSCMNVAPRFGTLAARFMSSNVRISHQGTELFA